MKNMVPCFKCGVELDHAGGDSTSNQPYNGTAFSTTGHWGSTYFDSIDGRAKIEIAICDDCLRANEKAIAGPFRWKDKSHWEL